MVRLPDFRFANSFRFVLMLTILSKSRLTAGPMQLARARPAAVGQQRGCAFWPFAWPKLPGTPTFYHTTWDREFDPYVEEDNNPEIPRNDYGVPAHIPPEIGQSIKHAVCHFISWCSTFLVPRPTSVLSVLKETR